MVLWNYIVKFYKDNKHSKECVIQDGWERIFNDLEYSVIMGTIETQKSIPIGSGRSLKPDIILRKNGAEVCAIEVKQESLTLDNKIENQLFSYLKQTKIKTGVIIADKLYIYAYEYNKDDTKQSKITIDFTGNNKDGEMFVSLFNYDSFSSEQIANFINEMIDHNNNVKAIRDNLSKTLVIEALNTYFKERYTKEEVEEALKSIEITIHNQQGSTGFTKKDKKSVPKSATNDRFDVDLLNQNGRVCRNYVQKQLIKEGLIDKYWEFSFAKLNKNNRDYWANPPIGVLDKNWCLFLINLNKREIYIFKIPEYSIKKEDVKTRIHNNKMLIDLEIVENSGSFVDSRSKIDFTQFLIQNTHY